MLSNTPSLRSTEQERRRNTALRLLYFAGAGELALLILLAISGGISAATSLPLIVISLELAAVAVAWVLARADLPAPAAHVFFLCLSIGAVVVSLPAGVRSPGVPALFIPVVGATLLLRPRWSFGYALLALTSYVLLYALGPSTGNRTISGFMLNTMLYGFYFGIVALLSYLASHGYQQLLGASMNYAEQLERARAELEVRVEERTRDVTQALADLRRSTETIQQMSVPVVPVAERVLALPLVGALDSQRASLLTERLLEAVQNERAHTVILDITGVPIVDTHVAGALLRAAQSLRLLGAEPVLVGIRAEVAQTVVRLGLDLSQITTRRDMRSGLAYALGMERLIPNRN